MESYISFQLICPIRICNPVCQLVSTSSGAAWELKYPSRYCTPEVSSSWSARTLLHISSGSLIIDKVTYRPTMQCNFVSHALGGLTSPHTISGSHVKLENISPWTGTLCGSNDGKLLASARNIRRL